MNLLLRAFAARILLPTSILFVSVPTAFAQPLEGYANYETFAAAVQELDKSDLVATESLGTTLGGRELKLLTVTGPKKTGVATETKPAILILGSAYAPQFVGNELALRMVQQIVAKPEDEANKRLLDSFVLYVIPRPNPDAMETMFVKPYVERALNSRPTDDDRDFVVDEDPNEDLNGDGWITMMRVEDPAGKWMTHPGDDRVMIEADPKKNETGRYLLYSEGVDNDGDELWNEDGPGGVDFNRNFTFGYAFFTRGAGPHQVSESESRAIADFAFKHTEIAMVFSFSPQDNLMDPWKPGADKDRIKTTVLSSDAERLNYLAEAYRKIHGGKNWPSAAKGQGDVAQWAYFHYGRWSLSARGWWVPKVGAEKDKEENQKPADSEKSGEEVKEKKSDDKAKDEKRGADDVNALRWFAKQGIDGFVPWTVVEHADFPGKKVEVGGFKPLLRLNPPAKELGPLAEKHVAFLGKVGGLMPRLQMETPKVKSLGGGIFRVSVRVLNTGYLPTVSEMGRISRLPNPLQLKIGLPEGAKLVTASPRVQIPAVDGNDVSKEHTWLVNATDAKSTAATVRVWSPSVGADEKAFELK